MPLYSDLDSFAQNILREAQSTNSSDESSNRPQDVVPEIKNECVIDIWKDGISVDNSTSLIHASAQEHELLCSVIKGIGRTISQQAQLYLAEDADIVIRLQPRATHEATQIGLKAVRMIEREEAKMRTRDEIQAELVRHEVDPRHARVVAMNEVDGWSLAHLKAIFDQLPRNLESYPVGPAFNLPGARGWKQYAMVGFTYIFLVLVLSLAVLITLPLCLLSGRFKMMKDAWIAVLQIRELAAFTRYVKPPLKMIKAAAKTGDTLCVNRRGHFKLMKDGYTALSHVDKETFGWKGLNGPERVPEDDRGLNYQHLLTIIDAIRVCKDEWIWLDNLAIPESLDEELKSQCINNMPTIYRNAGSILILDALTIQMKTRNLTDVAVVLACGKWITRAWCYQEVKLADWDVVKVVTADGKASVASMFNQLHQLARNDEAMYEKLFQTFLRLQKRAEQLTLWDIAAACHTRLAGLDEDYARAFFPTLGLKWEAESDRIQGMIKLYESRPEQAAQLAALHGPRGLPDPWGWAPAYLCGLEGPQRKDLSINHVGELVGSWWSVEVTEVRESFNRGEEVTVRVLTVASTAPLPGGRKRVQISTNNGLHLHTRPNERLKLIELTEQKFQEWKAKIRSEQKTFLLCSEEMFLGVKSFAVQVLLVALEQRHPILETSGTAPKPELRARVYLSGALHAGNCYGTQQCWILV